MTFQEYLDQENPKKMPDVRLQPEDCFRITRINWLVGPKGHNVLLKINGELYQYWVPEGEERLWTTDIDGNVDKRSCFRLMALPWRKK